MLRSLDRSSPIVNRKPVRERDYSLELQQSGAALLPAVFHNFHLVTVYLTGETRVARTNRASRSCRRISSGESSIRPAGQGDRVEWHGHVHCLHIHIHPRLLRCVGEAGFGDTSLAFDARPKLRDPLIREVALELNDSVARDAATPQHVHDLVTALSHHLLSAYAAREAPPVCIGRLSVGEILDTLRDTPASWDGVTALAKRAGLTRWHFSRQVRAIAGVSPSQFLQRSRVEAAKHLLERGRPSISDVAYQLGFADQSHFTRTFRRATGITPAKYRSDPRL